jgi:hypothetical protein
MGDELSQRRRFQAALDYAAVEHPDEEPSACDRTIRHHVAGQVHGEPVGAGRERERILKALRVLEFDSHQFSTRGCKTCRHVSDVLGTSFGCVALAEGEAPKR